MSKKINGIDVCEEKIIHKDLVQNAATGIPDTETLDSLSELFKIFSDATRLKIICALFKNELCVCNISELLNLGQSAVSHQLRILRTASLVKVRREGRSCYYSLKDNHVSLIFKQGLDHVNEKRDK